jgi:hypothetical protein
MRYQKSHSTLYSKARPRLLYCTAKAQIQVEEFAINAAAAAMKAEAEAQLYQLAAGILLLVCFIDKVWQQASQENKTTNKRQLSQKIIGSDRREIKALYATIGETYYTVTDNARR